MAKSSTPKTGKTETEADKPVPETQAEETGSASDVVAQDADAKVDADPVDTTDDPAPDEDTAGADVAETAEEAPLADESAAPDADPVAQDATPPEPAPEPRVIEKVVERRGSPIPLVIGGVVAGLVGYGIATYQAGQGADTGDLAAQIEDQAARIAELEQQVSSLPPPPDLAPLEARVDQLRTNLTARLDATISTLTGTVNALDARLTELEKMPNADGTLSDTALAAYERELEALRASVAEAEARIAELAAQAEARLEATQEEIAAMEAAAAAEARAAAIAAATARIRTALDTGSPFDEAVAALADAGVSVPAALSDLAAEGAPTAAELRETFPPAARAALAAARRAEGSTGGGMGSFLSTQFNIRSTEPREGNDPDAVLSRMEAAVRADDLSTALAESELLPEAALAELDGWMARARARAEALAALDTLATDTN